MFVQRIEEVSSLIRRASYTKGQEDISEEQAFFMAQEYLRRTAEKEGCVYVIGNGGSAAIASHFCIDCLKAVGIASMTLTDSAVLTCLSNDLGYEQVFSKQLMTIMSDRDLLVAISSSGQSRNILNAVQAARTKGASVITLSGFLSQNPLRQQGDLNFWLDSSDYGLVEMGHFSLLHTIIDALCGVYAN